MKRMALGVILFAGVAILVYLATVGCCHLMAFSGREAPLSEKLKLTPGQRRDFAALEKEYLAQKEASCQRLCFTRAQLIQLLKAHSPDRALISSVTDEIGREQTALERTTLDYLLTLQQKLDPQQRGRLVTLVSGQLSRACEMTACSEAGGCFVKGEKAHGS